MVSKNPRQKASHCPAAYSADRGPNSPAVEDQRILDTQRHRVTASYTGMRPNRDPAPRPARTALQFMATIRTGALIAARVRSAHAVDADFAASPRNGGTSGQCAGFVQAAPIAQKNAGRALRQPLRCRASCRSPCLPKDRSMPAAKARVSRYLTKTALRGAFARTGRVGRICQIASPSSTIIFGFAAAAPAGAGQAQVAGLHCVVPARAVHFVRHQEAMI